MLEEATQYFIMADQYLESSKLLLTNMIKSGNSTFGIGKNVKEAENNMERNGIKSDITLFIPALFCCYQCSELFIKGLLILKKENVIKTHEMTDMICKLKEKFGENSEIYITFNSFYEYQIKIIDNYKTANNIATIKEFYESLRYPENNGKWYSYIGLKYNDEDGITMFKQLVEKLDQIKELVIKEYKLHI